MYDVGCGRGHRSNDAPLDGYHYAFRTGASTDYLTGA